MNPLQMLIAHMTGGQPIYGHGGGESQPMSMARSKIAQMFGMMPGMQDEAEMSAPRMEAQRRIDRMFSALPQSPDAIRAAIGADRY